MREAVCHIAMPTQALLTLGCLLSKKLGGTRRIAIYSTFYVLLTAVLNSEVRDWDIKVDIDSDSVLPGFSPCEEMA